MSKFLNADEVVERLFDDDFSFSKDDSSDKKVKGYLPMLDNSILTPQRWQL